MSYESAALVANGEIENFDLIAEKVRKYPYIVAVDGGLNHCRRMGIKPDLIAGDLDSASPDILKHYEGVRKVIHPVDKDLTDLEIALQEALSFKPEKITLFGALGNRTDHTLFNLILLSRYPGKLFLETEGEQLFVIDREVELDCFVGQVLSLLPLNGPVTGITTKGLKWELSHRKMDKHFMGISNVCLKPKVKISVGKGDLLCCLNH